MKVWIVLDDDCVEPEVHGVFTKKALAKKHLLNLVKSEGVEDKGTWEKDGTVLRYILSTGWEFPCVIQESTLHDSLPAR